MPSIQSENNKSDLDHYDIVTEYKAWFAGQTKLKRQCSCLFHKDDWSSLEKGTCTTTGSAISPTESVLL